LALAEVKLEDGYKLGVRETAPSYPDRLGPRLGFVSKVLGAILIAR
jgi:hypothetical protein